MVCLFLHRNNHIDGVSSPGLTEALQSLASTGITKVSREDSRIDEEETGIQPLYKRKKDCIEE